MLADLYYCDDNKAMVIPLTVEDLYRRLLQKYREGRHLIKHVARLQPDRSLHTQANWCCCIGAHSERVCCIAGSNMRQ